jgi:hypothetical protein
MSLEFLKLHASMSKATDDHSAASPSRFYQSILVILPLWDFTHRAGSFTCHFGHHYLVAVHTRCSHARILDRVMH